MFVSNTPKPPLQNILSINEIRLNQPKSQLSLSYNNGINIYSTSDFRMLYTSNEYDFKLGNIAHCAMIYNTSTVAFIGSSDNTTYNNYKVVLYDLNSKSEINSIPFNSALTSIDIAFTYLIISTANDVQIHSFKDEQNIYLVHTIELNINNKQHQQQRCCPFIVWTTTQEDVDKVNICTFTHKNNEMRIHSFFSSEFVYDKEELIAITAFNDIERMFYIKEHKMLLAIERNGQRFSGVNVEHKETQYIFYRGASTGDITDACGLNDNHIAIVNMKKTIHIYKIEYTKGGYLSYIIPSFLSTNYIYSFIKIRLSDVILNEENAFFKYSYDKHGCVIFNSLYNNNNNELIIIGYNGYVYKVKLDFINAKYNVVKRDKFVSDEIHNQTVYVPMSSTGKGEDEEEAQDKWSII